MLRFFAALSLSLAVLPASAAFAAELVFVEIKSCHYCMRFNRQMARAYEQSDFGKKVPLRRVNLRQRWPADLRDVDRPPYTPVFILVDEGRELGRFIGYSSPAQFNRELGRLIKQLN